MDDLLDRIDDDGLDVTALDGWLDEWAAASADRKAALDAYLDARLKLSALVGVR
jgi:sugar phosphate isomerase/epimerase